MRRKCMIERDMRSGTAICPRCDLQADIPPRIAAMFGGGKFKTEAAYRELSEHVHRTGQKVDVVAWEKKKYREESGSGHD